jgi:Glycosyl transferase family 2
MNPSESPSVRSAARIPGRADGAPVLCYLENQLDAVLWRGSHWVVAKWRSRSHKFAQRAERTSFRPLLEARGVQPESLAWGLAVALRAGAWESAHDLALKLEPRVDLLPPRRVAKAREDLIETSVVCGDFARARRLALANLEALRLSRSGSSLLELLGLGTAAAVLPDGSINALALSRRISADELDAEELARVVGGGPRRWLRNPELALLFWSSLLREDPSRALGWLNRFLRWHGLPPYRRSGEQDDGGHPLQQLEPASLGSRTQGPLVSVLVPVRNASDTLYYSVRSLLQQTYESLEILLCDDASGDASWEVMKELAARDSRVRLFRSTANQGAYNVRNALARHARGHLLACHDADDLALPSRIAEQVVLLRETGAAACVASWLRLDGAGRVVFFKNQTATRMALATTMFTRDAFERFGPFRSVRVGADQELFADLCASGPSAVVRLRKPLTLALWQQTSATRAYGTEALENGYRSPLRRAYAELIHSKHADCPKPTSSEIDERLRGFGNLADASDIVERS